MKSTQYLMVGLWIAQACFYNTGYSVIDPQVIPKGDLEYQKALAKLDKYASLGKTFTEREYKTFKWSGRTAFINYVCSTKPASQCRYFLELGLRDAAMVIRDHAFRVILSSQMFLPEEKQMYAKQIIADNKNYRNTAPLWIVKRAQNFLSNAKVDITTTR